MNEGIKTQTSNTTMQTWGMTAVSALAGGLIAQASARGVVAIVARLASPPLALALGAIGGGLLGWRWMQSRRQAAIDHGTASQEIEIEAVIAEVIEELAAPTTTVTAPIEPTVATIDQTRPTDEVATIAIVAVPASTVDRDSEQEPITENTTKSLGAGTVAPATVEATSLDTLPAETNLAEVPPQASAINESNPTAAIPDQLESIHGIGPTLARRLRAAGIHTFAQLAELSPEQIKDAIAPVRAGSRIDFEHWIAEARRRAEKTLS